jgi:hypothetical protein
MINMRFTPLLTTFFTEAEENRMWGGGRGDRGERKEYYRTKRRERRRSKTCGAGKVGGRGWVKVSER